MAYENEPVSQKDVPVGSTAQCLSAPRHGGDSAPCKVIVSRTRHRCEELAAPALMRVVLSTLDIERLRQARACLAMSGGNELHIWGLTGFDLFDEFDPADHDVDPIQISLHGVDLIVVKVDVDPDEFDGVHACVFADGDVSFYIKWRGDNPVFAIDVVNLGDLS